MSLTQEQLTSLLDHINYPESKHAADPLRRLHQLMLHHIARVPFENVALHYSPTHRLSLRLDDLYEKVVVRSKGGYCVELNALFAALLRGLGYTVLTVAGRVRAGNEIYTGWSHMCLLVTIDGRRYMADVGFGADAAMQPVPLVSGTEFTVLAPRRGRLEHRSIDMHTDPAQRLWVYSSCDGEGDAAAPWVEQYCFVEMESFPADYEIMNYYTSTSPKSFFATQVLAVRALVEEDSEAADGGGGGEHSVRLVGVQTFFRNEVRRRHRGGLEKEVVQTVATEQERVAALEKWFQIRLSDEDRQGIFATGLALDS